MSTRAHSTSMTNKECTRGQAAEMKTPALGSPHIPAAKLSGPALKAANKAAMPTSPLPPVAPAPAPLAPAEPDDRPELLGSLTTEQQQRTSARVIKKLRLDDAAADRDKKDVMECEANIASKMEDKDKLHTVKQRMPKALWSAGEKDLFFEALNDYGKDFDAITSYIYAKMKKRGMCDVNMKTRNQVSHFYYRTWHKLSKHVHFDEKVKKVAQELYALINYGELRKKLSSMNEKTCARLGELVATGSLMVRARGRNVRVRTPMCRALRRLNHISERSWSPRLCRRASVSLRARDSAAWWRVQASAHNPRAGATVPLRTQLVHFIHALKTRWHPTKRLPIPYRREAAIYDMVTEEPDKVIDEDNLEDHLNLETDRMVLQTKKLTLHVGPRPKAEIHLPTISPGEHLSSQKICFSSYLERMGSSERFDGGHSKIRTPKRQRKDSMTEKEMEQKKAKMEFPDNKLMDIDETAIDGIELMASLTENKMNEEEKPSTETEDLIDDHEHVEKEKYMSEKEKDSFSEMEDDEKYNKSDTDNESDNRDKLAKDTKFKDLKVKFRIRHKKRGGSVYSVVTDGQNVTSTQLYEDHKTLEENAMNPDELGKAVDETGKSSEEQAKVAEEEAKASDEQAKGAEEQAKASDEQAKVAEEPSKLNEYGEEKMQPDFDVDLVVRQIRSGWSTYDAGKLNIGDLYLMFGSRSRLDLDYWWAEPSPPLPKSITQQGQRPAECQEKVTPEKESGEDERLRESDNELFSPKNAFSQDSNSGDERKYEQQRSPEQVKGALRLPDKLINRPRDQVSRQHRADITQRLKRLVSLASCINVRCGCSHACQIHRRKPTSEKPPANVKMEEMEAPIFRHPVPIAPKANDTSELRPLGLKDLPRWRRGRQRRSHSGVVVQRLLPLLPKQAPPTDNLIPVKLVSNAQPKLLPKPPVASCAYAVNHNEDQYYTKQEDNEAELVSKIEIEPSSELDAAKLALETSQDELKPEPNLASNAASTLPDNISGLLGSESLSMSPSRLLRARGEDGWLAGDVHDFSLSSFLAHLDHARPHDMQMESQLQSLMTETSIDYVAKFADLAAEVADDPGTD